MNISIVDLRYRMKSVLRAIDRGESVTVLYRGKEKARLIPSPAPGMPNLAKPSDHAACGIWAGRTDLDDPRAYVRELRQSRVGALFAGVPPKARAKGLKKIKVP